MIGAEGPAPTGGTRARRILSRTLLVIASASVGLLLVRFVIGGFVVAIGPIRLSLHRWAGLVAVAASMGILATLIDRHEPWRARLVRAVQSPHRSAAALAIGASVIAGITAYALGTHAPSGADASGYVSQAALWRTGSLRIEEPLACSAPWPDAAWTLAPLGYRPGTEACTLVPTYPPGLPLLMAAASAIAGPPGVFVVVPLLAALAVICAFALGRALHSPGAGACAAIALATSPVFLYQAVQPMSDVPVTALWAASLVAALGTTGARATLAGVLAAMAILVRPNLAPLAAAVGLLAARTVAPRTWTDLRPRTWRALCFSLPVIAAAAVVAVLNRAWYGSVARSGYGSAEELFSIASIPPNLSRYAGWLIETQTPIVLLAALSPLLLVRRAGRSEVVTPLLIAGGLFAGLNLAAYLPYAVFDQWDYLRFLLPSLPLLLAATWACAWAITERIGAAVHRARHERPDVGPGTPLREDPPPADRWRWALLLAAALIVGQWHVQVATQRDALRLAALERRYLTTASWISGATTAPTVVITSQQSGSVRFLTRRTIVRWDLLDPAWLDRAVVWLADEGRPPLIVVEAWEEAAFKARFVGQSLGSLDWPPAAIVAGATPVRVYDPRDRTRFARGEAVHTTRVFEPRR